MTSMENLALPQRPHIFSPSRTDKLCASHKTKLHVIVIINLFDVHAFLWSQWMTAVLSNLPLYVSISDVTASQSRAGVNQQPSYNRIETHSEKLQTRARENLGCLLFLSVQLLQHWRCVFSKVGLYLPEALHRRSLSGSKKKMKRATPVDKTGWFLPSVLMQISNNSTLVVLILTILISLSLWRTSNSISVEEKKADLCPLCPLFPLIK